MEPLGLLVLCVGLAALFIVGVALYTLLFVALKKSGCLSMILWLIIASAGLGVVLWILVLLLR